MYGIIVQVVVDANREDEARKILHDMVVPQARTRPGFTAGYWLRSLDDNVLRAVQIYDSDDTARAAAEHIRSAGAPPGAPVTLQSVDIYEVLARA
jgi:hypothetical protein